MLELPWANVSGFDFRSGRQHILNKILDSLRFHDLKIERFFYVKIQV